MRPQTCGFLFLCSLASVACGGGTSTPDAAVVVNFDAAVATPDAAPDCSNVYDPSTCLDCVELNCCAAVLPCEADATCKGCIDGTVTTGCDTSTLVADLGNCAQSMCATECTPVSMSVCNPVTNEGCTGVGDACDYGQNGFACYPPPNDALVCGACDPSAGPFCGPTMTCAGTGGTQCTRFCCDDGDCGTGHCDLGSPVDGVGVCTDAAGTGPSCDSAETAPSTGSCYTGAVTG